jgi:alpha-aminoadipic semialdehyde synthase
MKVFAWHVGNPRGAAVVPLSGIPGLRNASQLGRCEISASVVGIRREDKSKWERRAPLVPAGVSELQARCGLSFLVQPSDIRVFKDQEYSDAGATISEDLSPADVVLAVKEVPARLIQAKKIYVFFAHVTKGQPYNMGMLRRLMELGCSLVDYEKITDDHKRRLIFFGRHAGYAGMIDTLRCLGQRLLLTGVRSPLAEVKPAYEYTDLAAAKDHLKELGMAFARSNGMPLLVFGFSGYGNVSSGAQEVFECLQPRDVSVADLPGTASISFGTRPVKVVFREEDMVEPDDPDRRFDLAEYYQHPERYRGCFEKHLPHLDVLVNAIYWEPRYPRLVTREWARNNYRPDHPPRLKVIGDISCDVEGSIELTLRTTQPDNPWYVYLPREDAARDGLEGDGPVIMAVDNLPCEIPKESSEYFCAVLKDMVYPLASADWRSSFEDLDLPSCLKRAVIVHNGELTPGYRYLYEHVRSHSPHADVG